MIDTLHSKRLRPAPVSGASLVLLIVLFLHLARRAPAEARAQRDSAPLPAAAQALQLPTSSNGATTVILHRQYLPVGGALPSLAPTCPTISAAQFPVMAPRLSYITDAEGSPDLNLSLRGWYHVAEPLHFVTYAGPEPPDRQHPLLLSNIVPGSTEASFVATYQVNEWDWLGCNCPVPRSRTPYPVTMLGLVSSPGQPVYIAARDLPVSPAGMTAMVIYADANQLALTYTSEDRVDTGYMVHLVNICVDPNLVALYRRLDSEGRHQLPAAYNNTVVGTALDSEVDVVVRDTGSFLDPRSGLDWWSDQVPP